MKQTLIKVEHFFPNDPPFFLYKDVLVKARITANPLAIHRQRLMVQEKLSNKIRLHGHLLRLKFSPLWKKNNDTLIKLEFCPRFSGLFLWHSFLFNHNYESAILYCLLPTLLSKFNNEKEEDFQFRNRKSGSFFVVAKYLFSFLAAIQITVITVPLIVKYSWLWNK